QASIKEPLSTAEGFLLFSTQDKTDTASPLHASPLLTPSYRPLILNNAASAPVKHFHLSYSRSTFAPFLVIVGCLDV
ncbi:hypothetical protein ACT0JI_004243, partial [Cronobacter turicensis]